MTTSNPLVISGAVEGVVDEAVLRRLVELAGARLGPVYGKKGKMHLQQKINGYNHAARISQWVVLVDLDRRCQLCPITARLLVAEALALYAFPGFSARH